MRSFRGSLALVSVLFFGAAMTGPESLQAQQPSLQIDAQGGLAVPAGATKDIWKQGPHARLEITYWFNQALGLRVSGSRDAFSGKDATELSGPFNAPDATSLQTTAGLSWRALEPEDTRWLLTVDVGGGMAHFTSEDFPADVDQPADAPEPDFEITDFGETYPAVTGGVKLGYRLTPQFQAYVGGRGNYIASDTDHFMNFAEFDADSPVPFSPLWSFPVQVGVAVSF